MAFGLTIGTERAEALQQSIQDELIARGYSPDADPVMAEYITILIINNKTPAQVNVELEELIGPDVQDHSFTDWLFAEAAKGATEIDDPPRPEPTSSERHVEPTPARDAPALTSNEASRRPSHATRNGVYQQALSQALPSSTLSGQKRSSSARSPSPSHPNKSRRTDLPTGPRAMFRDGTSHPGSVSHPNPRSLLDRVGGPAGRNGGVGLNDFGHDEIQSRIDNIVNSSDPGMMIPGGYPGMAGIGGMDMNAMAGMANPLMLQEMMINQMALMAQMANSMGMMNGNPAQYVGPGFPMQGMMPGDTGVYPGSGMNNGFQGPAQTGGNTGRGRGSIRGSRGSGRGRGGGPISSTSPKSEIATSTKDTALASTSSPLPIATPTPLATEASTSFVVANATASPAVLVRGSFAVPDRPQSPTLCKFNLKCTNAHCRYAHPSPVATAESGVVLSNEACEKGKGCQDKDCIKGHVSPAALNPQEQAPQPANSAVPTQNPVSCRFGAACTRPGCSFGHPPRPSHASNQNAHFAQQCRFGASCTRATCLFQHPEGRVLPSTFHRGLSTNTPLVNTQKHEIGSLGGPSPHRSVKFNNTGGPGVGVKEKLERQMKEIEERKLEAENAVKAAEAAASKDDAGPVAITV
ncbi:hypothetical protein BDZ94DRAFT_1207039 [Collybia nuda]|uniref:C3H1-type domain-containing protein n=1 Tax=Collybia nuda TaxID=64659 RepID=A0A9P5YJW8_9AGAR|nr:hypothetical protein BDZ94DRAFT_1207039 [Collybia nuda]